MIDIQKYMRAPTRPSQRTSLVWLLLLFGLLIGYNALLPLEVLWKATPLFAHIILAPLFIVWFIGIGIYFRRNASKNVLKLTMATLVLLTAIAVLPPLAPAHWPIVIRLALTVAYWGTLYGLILSLYTRWYPSPKG